MDVVASGMTDPKPPLEEGTLMIFGQVIRIDKKEDEQVPPAPKIDLNNVDDDSDEEVNGMQEAADTATVKVHDMPQDGDLEEGEIALEMSRSDVYVGNLPSHLSERSLKRGFRHIGNMLRDFVG